MRYENKYLLFHNHVSKGIPQGVIFGIKHKSLQSLIFIILTLQL